MIAGTIVLLEDAVDEPLESTFQGLDLPGISVDDTQTSFDDRPVQRGMAADRSETAEQRPEVMVEDGEPAGITTVEERVADWNSTDWVADVTGSGLLIIESIDGDGRLDFPLDLFSSATGRDIERLRIDIEQLQMAWTNSGDLTDVWMRGADAGDGATIEYHEAASASDAATIGLGFERGWNGTIVSGVVYEGGYVALHNTDIPSRGVRFIVDELLPFAEVIEDGMQALLGDADEDTATCDECGREPERDLEEVGDQELCIVCANKAGEDSGAEA